MQRSTLSLLCAGLLALAGCSETSIEGFGRVEAVILDPPAGSAVVIGNLSGDIQASVSADGTTWVNLGSPNGISVPLQTASGTATVHGSQQVDARSYNRVRLVLTNVTAKLKSGSVVGGTTLTADTDVALGGSDNRVEIVVSVPSFTVEANEQVQHTALFDLNSQLWLTAAAVQAGNVADAAIVAAVTATTRLDAR